MVEVRGIEPLSEEVSHKAATGVVSGQDSPAAKSTDKLSRSVASSCMAGSKLSRLTFTAKFDALFPDRGYPGRTAALSGSVS